MTEMIKLRNELRGCAAAIFSSLPSAPRNSYPRPVRKKALLGDFMIGDDWIGH